MKCDNTLFNNLQIWLGSLLALMGLLLVLHSHLSGWFSVPGSQLPPEPDFPTLRLCFLFLYVNFSGNQCRRRRGFFGQRTTNKKITKSWKLWSSADSWYRMKRGKEAVAAGVEGFCVPRRLGFRVFFFGSTKLIN